MKTRNILLILFAILGLCSCEDMFEPAKDNTRQEDAFIEESKYTHGLLIYAYERLPYITTSQTDVATDDAVTNDKNSGYMNMATGTWTSDQNPMSMWNTCREGIQSVNKFLSLVEKTKWTPSSATKNQMFIDRLKGEAYGLRAIFNYYLLQAHAGYANDGILYGVPLLTEPEDASSDFNRSRATFAECVQRIFADCDMASSLLPDDYIDIDSKDKIPDKYVAIEASVDNYNSVFGKDATNLLTGKVAEAVKGQVALLASSPAFRDHSNVTSEDAAKILAEVIKKQGVESEEGTHGIARFDQQGHIWYKNKTKIESVTSLFDEILWAGDRVEDAAQEKDNFPPSLYGNGRINPSQNLVDAYPMRNGLPIDDPKSGYDPSNPYANRDPRLTNDILYNERTYQKAVIVTGKYPAPGDLAETSDNIGSISTSTRTGYYLAKLLREEASPQQSNLLEKKHIYPRIRYTEIYLAFAEAANEAWGPTGDPNGYGFSAYSIIEMIRKRAGLATNEVGMPLPDGDVYLKACGESKETMAKLIRNERRIELCFENKRFWDLRRWLMPLNETVWGMEITRDDATLTLTYTPVEVESRKYEDYQYYGPIPYTETLKWSNLKQNKGWK